MENILKLQYLSLCTKVNQQLQNHTGINNRDLTEFIIQLAKQSDDEQTFQKKLQEEEAEFSPQFIQNIFKLIKRMLPSSKIKGAVKSGQITEEIQRQEIQQQVDAQQLQLKRKNERLEQLRKKFPALAMQDQLPAPKQQEIQLDELLSSKSWSRSRSNSKQKEKQKEKKSKKDQEKDAKKSKQSQKHKRKNSSDSSSRSDSKSSHSTDKRGSSEDSDKANQKKQKDHVKEKDQQSNNNNNNYNDDNRKQQLTEVKLGGIYEATVSKIMDYGVFVMLDGFNSRKEGLIHLTLLKQGRISNAFSVVKPKDKVKVKCVSIVGNRMNFSLKDVDQKTGLEIEQKVFQNEDEDDDLQFRKNDRDKEKLKRQFGDITGVKIEDEQKKDRFLDQQQKELNPQDLWELSRLKYQNHLGLIQDSEEIQEVVAEEEELHIEVTEKEAPFLRGQTSRAGVNLSPVRIVKMQEGSLSREAANAIQFAKERREMREQQQRALMDSMNKEEFNKYWDDPNADPATRALAQQIKGLGQQAFQEPEFKKEAMFQTSRVNHRSHLTIKEQKESLPIFQFQKELIQSIMENKVLIVIGETGSGKTTQMTQYMLEAGFARSGLQIGCTQPRRVAAMSVAKRVAEEMGVTLGEEVGYSIRFEDITGPNTVVKYMTDGMLLREALLDPDMKNYSIIMLDQAHERQLGTDVLFGLLKRVSDQRKDFKLIVTSATLDAEKFSNYFFDCKIFRIPGRTFQVDILYSTEPETDYLDSAIIVVMQIHLNQPAGDILLFLTGQEEIDNACQILSDRMKKLGTEAPQLVILPCYSALPNDLQNRIFLQAQKGTRKVVIATNIAEASITIDGIYYVVDPGFCKIKVYNPKLGMDSLVIAPISQASARQRAGRAGRTGPGQCYRLYTEQAYKNEMLPTSVPEIKRTNLAPTVLLLKAMGIQDLLSFDFMDPPPIENLIAALEQLYALGALDGEGLLTKLGLQMAEFPLEPPLAKMLLTSVDLGCSDEIATVIAMISVPNVIYRPKDKQNLADQKHARFHNLDGDHLTLLTIYEAWKQNNFSAIWCSENYIDARAMKMAQDVRKQLVGILDRFKLKSLSAGKDFAQVRKSICAGFFFHSAKKRKDEGYDTIVDEHQVYIHPSSSVYNRGPEWVVYHELTLTSKEYMRNVSAIDPRWLIDVAPNFFQKASDTSISNKQKQEKLEPLFSKYEDPNAWRLSRR